MSVNQPHLARRKKSGKKRVGGAEILVAADERELTFKPETC